MIRKIGTLGRFGGPILVDRIITNSVVVAISDAVNTTGGFAALGTAGARVLGHVESFIGSDGLTPVKDGTLLQNAGQTYTAASNNETVDKVRVRVDVDTSSLYSAELDVAVGTTAGSDEAGKTFDLVDANTLDESTVAETSAQYYSHGLDQTNTAQVVVNILESEVFGF
jgi:hypothetical protein